MKYALWLACTGVTSHKIQLLLKTCHSAREVYEMPKRQLEKVYGINEADVDKLVLGKEKLDPDVEMEKLSRQNISFLSMEQEEYPKKLKDIHNPPYALFYLGSLPKATQKTAAIVGARSCSAYGGQMAHALAKALSEHGISVISGLARGIDAEGHKGCLAGGAASYGILGCGVDVCYPRENRSLYEKIPIQGGILSEYPPGTNPLPAFFPARNRIISGLSDCVIVMEARKKSGSLITADYAMEQGREVYALPGRITDPLSCGCNELIKQGAGILCGVEDFLEEWDILKEKSGQQINFIKNVLEKDELLVYSLLDFCPTGIGTMLEKLPVGLTELLDILERLEQKGVICEQTPNFYIRRL